MQIKGSAIESIPIFVKSRFGDQAYQQWIDALSPEARAVYTAPIFANRLYSVKTVLVDPTIVICNLFYKADLKGAEEQGRFSAEHTLKGIYKIFVKLGSPEFIIGRASTIMATFYEGSAMEVAEKGDHTATVRITKFDEPHRVVELRIKGWIEKALEISGAKNVVVTITQSLAAGAKCTDFHITWK